MPIYPTMDDFIDIERLLARHAGTAATWSEKRQWHVLIDIVSEVRSKNLLCESSQNIIRKNSAMEASLEKIEQILLYDKSSTAEALKKLGARITKIEKKLFEARRADPVV